MAQDFTDNRLGEHLKIDLNASLQAMATGRAADQVFLQGKHYPCTVAQVISPGIVKINFEVNAAPFTLPQMTVPVVGSEYMRQPIQVGDKGMCIAADVRLGGITGLGTGVPDLTAPGNLSGLAFHWLGNVAWPTQNDLSLPIDPTAVSFYSSLSCVTSVGSAGVIVSGSHANLTVNGVSNLLGGSNTITMPIGDSSLNIATTAFVTGSIGHPGSGYLPLSGGTLSPNGLAVNNNNITINNSWPALILNKPASGTGSEVLGYTNGVIRWSLQLGNSTAESGSNAGSDLGLYTYSDTGGYITNPLTINRANGNAWFSNNLTAGGTGTFTNQVQINVGGTNNSVPFVAYQSSLPAGGTMYFACGGVAWGNYNNGAITFSYSAANSQNNSVNMGVLGGPNMTINGYGYSWFPSQITVQGNGLLYLGTGSGGKIQFDGSVGNDGSGSTLKIDIYGSGPGTYGIGLSGSNQYYLSGGSHHFWTGGTQTLALDNGGNGTFNGWVHAAIPPSNVSNGLPVNIWGSGSYQAPQVIGLNWGGTTGYIWYNNWGNQVYWSTAQSDRRRKSNIRIAGNAIDYIKRLKVYDLDFTPKAGPDYEHATEHWPFSLIADEVAKVMPHAAIQMTDKDENGKDTGDPQWVGLHPLHLCAVLWKAVQQLTEQNESLSARVAALEARA